MCKNIRRTYNVQKDTIYPVNVFFAIFREWNTIITFRSRLCDRVYTNMKVHKLLTILILQDSENNVNRYRYISTKEKRKRSI